MIAFLTGSILLKPNTLSNYIDNGIANDAPDLDSAIRVVAHANAGWGKSSSGSAVTRAINNAYPIAEDALKKYIGVPPAIADPNLAPDFVFNPIPVNTPTFDNIPPVQVAGYSIDGKSQLYLLGTALVVIGLGIVLIRKKQQSSIYYV